MTTIRSYKVLHPLLDDLKAFFNDVVVVEDDIFEVCPVSWTPYKTCKLSELYKAMTKLEGCSILDVTPEVVFKVATAIGVPNS